MLSDSVENIKGIGKKAEEDLNKIKIYTHKDLLEHFPIRYEYYAPPISVEEFIPSKMISIKCIVTRLPVPTKTGNGQYISMNINGKYLNLLWFHNPYISRILQLKKEYVFRGSIIENGNGTYSMVSPTFYTVDEYSKIQGVYEPVYRQSKNLKSGKIRNAIEQIKDEIEGLEDFVADNVRTDLKMMKYSEAVYKLHFPQDKKQLTEAIRSIKYMELYQYLKAVHDKKQRKCTVYRMAKFKDIILPFELTDGQKETWLDIQKDMDSGIQMRRLVQGDVGSGKSIVAFLSMIAMGQNGYQSALLAPTEILAQQHYEAFVELLKANNLYELYHPVLLTGSTTAKEKNDIYQLLLSGKARMVIGTHAILSDKITFHSLGLVVTDEQHRFGVEQRNALNVSGYAEDVLPHILAMSATPIPRSLAGILYGDMDISIIKTKPRGRMPVKNCLIPDNKRNIGWKFIEKEVVKGRQAYIVCSMVDENDKDLKSVKDYVTHLNNAHPNLKADVLYGAMHPWEKEEVMQRFSKGELDVLISTTVIEVGVNVPNASVMMIENAERFGLAQLHQLRGRIGRGKEQSYCIFIQGDGKEENERLRFISSTNDGFEIAEKDMQLRGAGDLVGTMQSGQKKFKIANIYTDIEDINQINRYLEKENDVNV